MIEENIAGEQKTIGRKDGDAFRTGFDGDWPADPQKALAPAIGFEAGRAQQVDIGASAAIQDGNFEIVDFHIRVIDAHAVEHAEQMLGGGDQHALPHQAGGVAHAGNVAPAGGNGKIVQIGADENDSGGGRRGQNANGNRDAAVQAYAARFDGSLNGGFKSHSRLLEAAWGKPLVYASFAN